MTLFLAYIGAAAFAAGVLMGGWVSYEVFAQRQYVAGVEAGQADERQRCEEKIALLTVRLQAEGLALQKRENERAAEINRIRAAAVTAGRVEYAESAALVGDLSGRLRDAEERAHAAAHRSDRSDRVSRAAHAAARAAEDRATAAGVVHRGAVESFAGIGARAELVRAQLALCLKPFEVSPPP